MADPEAGDRRVVGGLVCADHPEGDVLAAAALDPVRASLAAWTHERVSTFKGEGPGAENESITSGDRHIIGSVVRAEAEPRCRIQFEGADARA
ncbi:hypothetical protein GCM10010193_28450 [Kitasatospora atroaurantiaca]